MSDFKVNNLSELSRVAEYLAEVCALAPTVALFFGPVGAGKTTLIQALMHALGSNEVSSPTYALHQTYHYGNNLRAEHLDLYRVENFDDLETTGLWDVLSGFSALVLIEWAEKLDLPLIVPGRQVVRIDVRISAAVAREISVTQLSKV